MKPPSIKEQGELITFQPNKPFEIVRMDFMGHFPRTERGNRYILVFMDLFTK